MNLTSRKGTKLQKLAKRKINRKPIRLTIVPGIGVKRK